MHQRLTLFLLLASTLFISACSENKPGSSFALAPIQLSSELADIYQRSCKNCHSVEATGAPLTGDTAKWQTILNKGLEAVIENTMNGYGGMPPFGQCFECQPEQFEQLVLYMAKPGKTL